MISAYPVGKIDGAQLDTMEQGTGFEKFYRRYVDAEGKGMFDRYTVRHRPDQEVKSTASNVTGTEPYSLTASV